MSKNFQKKLNLKYFGKNKFDFFQKVKINWKKKRKSF